jgi:hypothetical protein
LSGLLSVIYSISFGSAALELTFLRAATIGLGRAGIRDAVGDIPAL